MSASRLLLVAFAASVYSGNCRFISDLAQQNLLNGDPCSECSQIVELSANMIPSLDAKVTIYGTLHALCRRLPRDQASECDLQVKTYLPKVLRQTPGRAKPGDTCLVFGLCGSRREEALPQRAAAEDAPASALGPAERSHTLLNPACALCLFVIKKLESLLPTNVTEDALVKLMGEVCDLLPESYKEQCDDFIAKYGAQIVEFLLSSAAPHTICTLLHLCLYEEQQVPEPSLPSDCESCRTLAALSRLTNGPNSTQPETSSFLQSVCFHYPNAIPKCEAFTRIYAPRLQKALGNQMDGTHVCEAAELCVPQQRMELMGKERCTWGPSYWCKDVQTARTCGSLAFCEKFVWEE